MAEKRLTIGVFIGNANSVHSVITLRGIRQAAKETGVNTISFLGVHTEYMFRDFYRGETSYDYQISTVYDYVQLAKCDALIISYGELVIFLKENQRKGFIDKFKSIPKIILEDPTERENSYSLIYDNYAGMRAVVEHLVVDHGYRHFVQLRGPLGNKDAEERDRAFRDVMNEYHIEITDDMVRVGDFSEAVESEIEYLFDHNPLIEAFVCANDLMASAVYKVCKRRRAELFKMTPQAKEWMKNSPFRYKIGVDIESGEGMAVTGFDDAAFSSVMDPPLTTVMQNQFELGYKAVYSVLDILSKGSGENTVLKTEMVRRNSCGCRDVDQRDYEPMSEHEKQNPEFYVIKLAERIKNAVIISDVNEGIADKVYDTIYDALYADIIIYLGYVKEQLSSKQVIEQLRSILNGPYADYISATALTKAFSDYLSAIIRRMDNHKDEVMLTEIMVEGMKYLQGHVYKRATEQLSEFEHNTWFMSMIARDMANHVHSEKEMYLDACRKIQRLNMGNTYIFTFKEPIVFSEDEEWICPSEIYLSAEAPIDGEPISYPKDERPVLNKDIGFEPFVRKDDNTPFHITITTLYSDCIQYGILASEVAPEDVLSMFYASVQIGTALKYNEMNQAQRESQRALEKLVREIEDKNSMLRFISEYDALTGCLNRRGFIEKAVELKNENPGKTCIVLFSDTDHLKEINDKFGHAEGDFAIKTMASLIRGVIGDNQIFGRIGGDEFIAVLLTEEENAEEELRKKIKAVFEEFNANCDKPFYVESSLGFDRFICSPELDLQVELEAADKALYESKRSRRDTIVK